MEYKKLGHIAKIQTGPFGSQLHQSDYKPTGIPCIMPCNIGSNLNIICDNIAYISEEDLNRLAKHKTQEGDIVYSRRGDIEKCAYISSRESGWLCGTGCLKVSIDSTIALPKYVAYLLSTPESKAWLVGNAVGTTMLNLNTTVLSDFPICLPDLDTQQKVVEIIDSIADKIELNKRINDNLEQQAQAAFNNIIAHYSECETINLSEIAVLNPKRTIAKGTLARSIEMAQLPTSGSFPAGWDMKEYNGGMKFQNGDTLMARITPCLENGKVAYINFLEENEVAFGSTEYIVIASKGAIAPEVFYFLARHNDFVDFAVKNMNGSSGRQRVSAETIGTYKLPVISPEDMVMLETIAKEALNKIKYNSLENIRLSEMRDTLLPKLMSGELKINEIDC